MTLLSSIRAVGLDYDSPLPATLTYISGQTVGGQRCTTLNVLDDLLIEDEEMVNVTLSVSLGDEDSVRFTTGESFTTVTIVEDPFDSMLISPSPSLSLSLSLPPLLSLFLQNNNNPHPQQNITE